MSKRIIVLLVAAVALVLASSASAAIPITQAQAGPGYQSLSPWTCSGKTFYLTPHQVTDQNGNPVTDQYGNPVMVQGSGNPIRLGFGWGAKTPAEMTQFFKDSHGSATISGTDSFSDQWFNSPSGTPFLTQQRIQWSALEPTTLTFPGQASSQGVSSWYRGTLSLQPGTYTLTVTFVFDKPIQDGYKVYRDPLSGTCTFTVAA